MRTDSALGSAIFTVKAGVMMERRVWHPIENSQLRSLHLECLKCSDSDISEMRSRRCCSSHFCEDLVQTGCILVCRKEVQSCHLRCQLKRTFPLSEWPSHVTPTSCL